MNQSFQQNATMSAQLNYRPSPQPAQQPSPSYQFKPQIPPFTKWYGKTPKTSLLLAKIATYKAYAFYAGVNDWTRTTQTNRQLSVVISSNMLASLSSSISSIFLNDAIFASEVIAMLYSLLTHLNPSFRENLLLEISYLTRLEMRLGESSIDYMSRVRGISQRMQGIKIDHIILFFAITSIDHDR